MRTLTTVECVDDVFFEEERPTLRERAAAGWDRLVQRVWMQGPAPAAACVDCCAC